MQRTTVQSEIVVSVGYEAATGIFELELSSGEVIQFYNVPLPVYIAFSKAASKGDYYHHNIRAQYECKQVAQNNINNGNDDEPDPLNN